MSAADSKPSVTLPFDAPLLNVLKDHLGSPATSDGDFAAQVKEFSRSVLGRSHRVSSWRWSGYSVLRLVYLDFHRGYERYTRESRNTFVYWDEASGSWKFLRFCLQRGAEVLTFAHEQNNVTETQDVLVGQDAGKTFDAVQQRVMKALATNEAGFDNKCVVTFKVDGQNINLLLAPQESTPAHVLEAQYADLDQKMPSGSFAGILANNVPTGLGYTVALGTNGSIFVGDEMVAVVVQAIASSCNVPLEETWEATWEAASPVFMSKVTGLVEGLAGLQPQDSVVLSFEAVLGNRKSRWNKRTLTELAVSYPRDAMILLSARFGFDESPGTFLPHFDIAALVAQVGFEQPAAFSVQSSQQLQQMILDLDEVAKDEKTIAGFTSDTFGEQLVNGDHINSREMLADVEGFVLYFEGEFGWDYSKVKTVLYYLFHKLRPSNVEKIKSLPKSIAKVYPNRLAVDELDCIDDMKRDLHGKLRALFLNVTPELFEEDLRNCNTPEKKVQGLITKGLPAAQARGQSELFKFLGSLMPTFRRNVQLTTQTAFGLEDKDAQAVVVGLAPWLDEPNLALEPRSEKLIFNYVLEALFDIPV